LVDSNLVQGVLSGFLV
jgi:hypothetical protein